MTDGAHPADVARRALEVVCSSRDDAEFDRVYAAGFVDHVNGSVHHGVTGARASVATYRRLFGSSYRFVVQEQIVEGSRVCSRFTLSGVHRGQRVEVWGLVTSRLDDRGQIVEDWAAIDTLQIVRQLGPWRSLLLGLEALRRR